MTPFYRPIIKCHFSFGKESTSMEKPVFTFGRVSTAPPPGWPTSQKVSQLLRDGNDDVKGPAGHVGRGEANGSGFY
ncbi:hypothetical protein L249_8426 [Ophiocordyceps polyrhachis-furcata BCC 54312]|uniref:Uncharacterized protein n=1 Tax=Ophiocordyceps polyrhachis-furcata BCC 54312 TaxID=1330021 RepID=A0A367L659_9HYPO|nr:hypothetical protein L249_8426 [Ophiocordyceps polyrhachis-furcata BCC 54312]